MLSKSRKRRKKIRKDKEKRAARVRKAVKERKKVLALYKQKDQGLQHSEGPRARAPWHLSSPARSTVELGRLAS